MEGQESEREEENKGSSDHSEPKSLASSHVDVDWQAADDQSARKQILRENEEDEASSESEEEV